MNSMLLEAGFVSAFFVMLSLFLARMALVAGGAQLWLARSPWAAAHRIVKRAEGAISWKRDFLPALRTILLDSAVTALFLSTGWLVALRGQSLLSVALTFLGFFVWFEVFFYYQHRLFHTKALYWMHADHHDRKATNPFTSLAFSVTERLVILMGSIGAGAILSHWIPISIDGMGLYFLFNYVMNVYGHLNVEVIPPRIVNTFFGRVANTTTYHALHHEKYRGHYGLFTQVLDRVHGTKFADYEVRQERAFLGG